MRDLPNNDPMRLDEAMTPRDRLQRLLFEHRTAGNSKDHSDD